MSIINQALQNVDSRGRPAVSAQGLPGEVRFAEPVQRRSRPIFLIALALAALFIAGGLFLAPAEVFSPFMAPTVVPRPVVLEGVGLQEAEREPPVAAPAVTAIAPAAALASQASSAPATGAVLLAPHQAPVLDPEPVDLALAVDLSAAVASRPPSVPTAAPREPLKTPAPVRAEKSPPRPAASISTAAAKPVAPQEVRLEAVQMSPAQQQSAEIRAANELMAARNYPEAEARLRAVLKQAPSSQAARLSLARLYALQFKRGDAKAVLREGLSAAPNDPALLLPLARLSADENDWQAAADVLAPAKNALAGHAEYQALTGAVLQGLGRFAESADAYRAALGKAPQTGVWWVGYALSLEADGQTKAAAEAFRQALQLPLAQNVAEFVQTKLARLPPA